MSKHKSDPELERFGFAAVEMVVADGPQKGSRFPLRGGENLIGRSPDCAVMLSETEVSRQHARVTVGQEIQLEDLGSAVGTLLNGRLMMGADFIFDNDEIKVGPYTLRLALKRRESRRGIIAAFACLGTALVVFCIAVLLPQNIRRDHAARRARSSGKRRNPPERWRDWDNLHLPTAKTLAGDSIAPTVAAARVQFNFATRLYQDRFGDPGNAYQALLGYKRALAILRALPVEQRPGIANRCLERMHKLRGMIRRECDKRVFAFQRAYELKWWNECLRVLADLRRLSPWSHGRYHAWARRQTRLIKRMLQED